MVDLEDPETSQRLQIDADASAAITLTRWRRFARPTSESQSGVDYVPSIRACPFDRALTGYLARRKGR